MKSVRQVETAKSAIPAAAIGLVSAASTPTALASSNGASTTSARQPSSACTAAGTADSGQMTVISCAVRVTETNSASSSQSGGNGAGGRWQIANGASSSRSACG